MGNVLHARHEIIKMVPKENDGRIPAAIANR